MSDIIPVLSDKACAFPAGLFHHAKIFNGVVYTTGQIGGDVSGNLVSGDISAQTEQAFRNLSAILEASNSSLERVLKVNIYMVDSTEYAAMNAVYTKIMPDPKPPRACVFAKGLPADAKVEMEMVAAVNAS